jgi:hypothetical protein
MKKTVIITHKWGEDKEYFNRICLYMPFLKSNRY